MQRYLLIIIILSFSLFSMPSMQSKTLVYSTTFKAEQMATSYGSIFTEDEVNYIPLPYYSMPMGITWDRERNVVWVACVSNPPHHEHAGIAKIDVETKNVTFYMTPWDIGNGYYRPRPWTVTVDSEGNVWFSINSCYIFPSIPDYVPMVGKFIPNTEEMIFYWFSSAYGFSGAVQSKNEYVWVLTNKKLLKVSLDCQVVEQYSRMFGVCMKIFGDELWLSYILEGKVEKLNISTGESVIITGFSGPLGIEVDNKNVYVAEYYATGEKSTIAVINKTTYEVTRLQVTSYIDWGIHQVYKDSRDNLWWTDCSYHMGLFLPKATVPFIYNVSRPFSYYMVEVTNDSIWFSCVGSAYIGIVHPPVIHMIVRNRIISGNFILAY